LVSNSQAKQPSTITGTGVSSGSTGYFCSPEITEEHITEIKCDLLGKQGSNQRSRNSVKSFAHFRHFLSNTPHIPERTLARELYHIMKDDRNAFGFINLNLRDGRGQTVSAHKQYDGDAHVDPGQVASPIEGDSGPSREEFKDDEELGGNKNDTKEEEVCQGSEHKASANRARDRAGISQ
jgi:hypothetical protein